MTSESETLLSKTITYSVSFRDFQFLQGYMARRIFAKKFDRSIGIVLNVTPYRAVALFGTSLRYPLSFYLLVIQCLVAAIACLIPAIRLRLSTFRMQVSLTMDRFWDQPD